MTITAKQLQELEAAYRAASRDHEAARNARNALMLKAIREGWTHAQIAKATGLTRARVGQIALTRKEQPNAG